MEWSRAIDVGTGRVAGTIAGVSLVATAAIVGVVAVVSGEAGGASGRFPYYVLATAVAFVASLWQLDRASIDGSTVLIATSGIAVGAGILFALAVEGLVYGVTNPGEIVGSHLLVYFLAAGLVCTGLGMWILRHWREFTVYESAESSAES